MGQLAQRLRYVKPSRDEIAQSLRNVGKVLGQVPGIWRIYLFGSCVDDSYHSRSDLDVAVIFETKDDYINQRSRVLRSKIETVLPWEPALLLRERFEMRKDVGGLCYEIFHRGTLIYDSGTKL